MDATQTKYDILLKAMGDIPFDGWSVAVFEKATIDLGFERTMFHALFPRGLHDTLSVFSSWADEKMMGLLEKTDHTDMRIRDKVAKGVETRIDILAPYRDCVRISAKLLARPQYARTGASITWNTADKIWNWAGDTATDYNRYTKRGLLSGVIGSTMIYWLQDESENNAKTREFLCRRIDNVLFIGKNTAPVIKPVASLLQTLMMRYKSS